MLVAPRPLPYRLEPHHPKPPIKRLELPASLCYHGSIIGVLIWSVEQKVGQPTTCATSVERSISGKRGS